MLTTAQVKRARAGGAPLARVLTARERGRGPLPHERMVLNSLDPQPRVALDGKG